MEGRYVRRPDDRPATGAEGSAAVQSPSESGTSPAPNSDSSGSAPTLLELGPDALIAPVGSAPNRRTSQSPAPDSQTLLRPGTVLGRRYEILQLLGQGGMGAVYRARDREVNRIVALKVIQPELAGNPAILERFKQELVLSHQVTHRNVIRIYDLGDADGIKFITMEYIEGQDLRTLIAQHKTFSPEEAVEIMRQVCRALEAAHAVGVIHRDLKPQNIMRDQQGRVVVMDFGLARSLESHDGMTQTGAIVGTVEYMSPEQGLGKPLDERSDLFTVGLIFYELLTGKMPYKADSALASLLKRTQERAEPVSDHNSSIPRALSDIVAKCLEPKVQTRYQNVGEILTDLEAWQGKGAAASLRFSGVKPWARTFPWAWVGVAAVIVVLAIAGFLLRAKLRTVAQGSAHSPVTLLVADFKNETSDSVFDGTLEPSFNLALESASFINSFNRGQAHTIGAQLRPGTTTLDESLARLVAVREGIGAIVTGSVSRDDKGFKITAKAVDAVTGKPIAETQTEAASKEDVLQSVGKLAAKIRTALGDTTPESVQLAKAETFTSSSLEAAHEYAVAQNLQGAGKAQESIPHYLRAVQLDPDMGRAYAGLAAASANMARSEDAEKYYQLAMARIDRMTDREKFRTRGGYYLLRHEPRKAIEEYTALVQQFPSDDAAHSNLAVAYMLRHDVAKALEEGREAVKNSHDTLAQINLAIYSIYGGDFQGAIKQAQAIMGQAPQNVDLQWVVAIAQLGLGQVEQATDTYQKMQKIDAFGDSIAAIGLADIALYHGNANDAIPLLEKGIAADLANKDQAAAAVKLAALGYAHLLTGKKAEALAAVERAISLDKGTPTLFYAGRAYIEAGQPGKALSLASQLQTRIEPDAQLYGKLLEAETRLSRGEVQPAITLLQAAQNSGDTWFGRFELGKAYLQAGLYTEAYSEFENCLKRRGEATAIFVDDVPTYRLLPPVYYYLGRAQEGLKSPAAKDSYHTFLNLQEKGTGPLVADARHRLSVN
jgi:eukaryotic-like serine/threonine-protein kinase